MEGISLRVLVEEAIADPSSKNFTGKVKDLHALFTEENLARLEAEYNGVFAFLAYHPSADLLLADYVTEGTLGSDSGPRLMVLYVDESKDYAAKAPVTAQGVEVATEVHLAYEALRLLFEPKPPPPLPGIAFFSRFTGQHGVVYVHLHDVETASAARAQLRMLFSLAEQASTDNEMTVKFADSFAATLRSRKFSYTRSDRTSLRERFIAVYQFRN